MDYIMSLVLLVVCALSHCEPLQEAVQRRSDVFGVYANEFARDYEPVAFAAVPLHAPLPVIHIVSTAPLAMPRYPPPQSRPRVPAYNHKPSYSHNVPSYVQAPTAFSSNSYAQQPTTYFRQPNTYAQPVDTYGQPSNVYRQQQQPNYAPSMAYTTNVESNVYRQQPNYAPSMAYTTNVESNMYRQQPNYAPSMAYTTNVDPLETEDDAPTILYARPQPHGGYTYRRRPAKKRVPPKRKEPVIIRVHKYRVVKGR